MNSVYRRVYLVAHPQQNSKAQFTIVPEILKFAKILPFACDEVYIVLYFKQREKAQFFPLSATVVKR